MEVMRFLFVLSMEITPSVDCRYFGHLLLAEAEQRTADNDQLAGSSSSCLSPASRAPAHPPSLRSPSTWGPGALESLTLSNNGTYLYFSLAENYK